jgi:hypothetical protein
VAGNVAVNPIKKCSVRVLDIERGLIGFSSEATSACGLDPDGQSLEAALFRFQLV